MIKLLKTLYYQIVTRIKKVYSSVLVESGSYYVIHLYIRLSWKKLWVKDLRI